VDGSRLLSVTTGFNQRGYQRDEIEMITKEGPGLENVAERVRFLGRRMTC
jgi:hypothetical protein